MNKRPASRLKMPATAKLVHDGVIFKVYQWEQELYDGSKTIFEKLSRVDTANVLAVKGKKIILTHQEQPGVVQPFVSALGGRLDEGEESLTAAKRELLEESGLESNDWVFWKAIQPFEKIDWATYVYIARDCRTVASPDLDAGEKITLVEYSFDDFVQATKKPNYRDVEITLMIARAEAEPKGLSELRRLIESS